MPLEAAALAKHLSHYSTKLDASLATDACQELPERAIPTTLDELDAALAEDGPG